MMKLLTRILSVLMLFAAFSVADTTTVAPVDSVAKKHAVWIKLEGDVEPSMYDFCARAIDDALKE